MKAIIISFTVLTVLLTYSIVKAAEQLIQSFDSSGTFSSCQTWSAGEGKCALKFEMPFTGDLTKVGVRGRRVGSPGNALLEVQGVNASTGVPNGITICSDTKSANGLPTSGLVDTWPYLDFVFSGCSLTQGIEYFVVLSTPSGNGTNYMLWGRVNINTNSHWSFASSVWTAQALTPHHYIYGEIPPTPTPTPTPTPKPLVDMDSVINNTLDEIGRDTGNMFAIGFGTVIVLVIVLGVLRAPLYIVLGIPAVITAFLTVAGILEDWVILSGVLIVGVLLAVGLAMRKGGNNG